MDISRDDMRERSMLYLKADLPDGTPVDMHIEGPNEPLMKNLGNGLIVTYLVDLGAHMQYVQRRHLQEYGMSESELHAHALHNVAALAEKKLKVKQYDDVYGVVVDGNFEASLILVDDLWDRVLADKVANGFVAAIPAREILAFCDVGSVEGISALRQVVTKANTTCSHLITPDLYRRQNGTWIKYEEQERHN